MGRKLFNVVLSGTLRSQGDRPLHEGGRRAVIERASARHRCLTISRSRGLKMATVDVAHSGGHQAKRLSRRERCQNQ